MSKKTGGGLRFVEGFYMPSFFRIGLETNTSPENIEGGPEEPTLLHEYIHFLQDASTVHGTLNLAFAYNQIRAAAEVIRKKCFLSTVTLPVNISHYAGLEASYSIQAYVFGDDRDVGAFPGIQSLQQNSKHIGKHVLKEHNMMLGAADWYKLGSRDVLESMAWGIESTIYPYATKPPDLPYNSVRFLIDYYAPHLQSADNRYLVALCEIALSTAHPIDFVISILAEIQKDGFTPRDLMDFFQYCSNGLQYSSQHFGDFADYEAVNSYFIDGALKETQEMFRNAHLEEARRWAGHVFSSAKELRAKHPLLIAEGIIAPDPRNYYFDLIRSQIGCPIIFNSGGMGYTYVQPANVSGLSYFAAFEQLCDLLLYDAPSGCFLQTFCRQCIHDGLAAHEVNEKCEEEPWNKHNDKVQCMFSSLWKGYGFARRRYTTG